jgi:hypothetical protein
MTTDDSLVLMQAFLVESINEANAAGELSLRSTA